MNLRKILLTSVFAILAALPGSSLHAAEPGASVYLPNMHGKSLTTPVAWGASNNVVFVGIGGNYPSPYTSDADGAAVAGFGVGDPVKNLGLQVALVSLDLTEWKEYSMSLHLSRNLTKTTAVGVGAESIMLTSGGDSDKSYYVVFSQGIQANPFIDHQNGKSKLHYSIGAGTSRFGEKSPMDTDSGKGKYGTYVFTNVAYEVANSFNIIADWNGLNLNAGVSKTFRFKRPSSHSSNIRIGRPYQVFR